MIKKVLSASAVILGLGTASASANCELNGVIYEVGTVICFDTFIQECTVAGYWSAIGNCRSDDPRFKQVTVEPSLQDRIDALMATAGSVEQPEATATDQRVF